MEIEQYVSRAISRCYAAFIIFIASHQLPFLSFSRARRRNTHKHRRAVVDLIRWFSNELRCSLLCTYTLFEAFLLFFSCFFFFFFFGGEIVGEIRGEDVLVQHSFQRAKNEIFQISRVTVKVQTVERERVRICQDYAFLTFTSCAFVPNCNIFSVSSVTQRQTIRFITPQQFLSVIWHHTDEFERKTKRRIIVHGHSLWSADRLPAQMG